MWKLSSTLNTSVNAESPVVMAGQTCSEVNSFSGFALLSPLDCIAVQEGGYVEITF